MLSLSHYLSAFCEILTQRRNTLFDMILLEEIKKKSFSLSLVRQYNGRVRGSRKKITEG